MSPIAGPQGRPRARSWLVGLLVGALLGWFALALGAGPASDARTTTVSQRFVPSDGRRATVDFKQGPATGVAMVEHSRLEGAAISYAMSPAAFVALEIPAGGLRAASWWREAVVPGALDQPARYRIRSVDSDGVWLQVQDWEDLGVSFEHLLELPTDVVPGRTWSSSGRALARPTNRQLSYVNTSSAAAAADADRAAAGCLSVRSTTELSGAGSPEHGSSERWQETNLWCPGAGVVENRGELRGTSYAVTERSHAPDPLQSSAEPPWDTAGFARWTMSTPTLYTGDATFGGQDAALLPGLTPAVTTSGRVVFPVVGAADLTALQPLGPTALWWHWWARPGGQVTAMATVGPLVVVTTTTRELAVYTAGGRLQWRARLDDVAVAPPVAVGGRGLAVGTVGGEVSLFDLGTGELRWQHRLDHGVHSRLATDGKIVVAEDAGPTVTVWDVGSGRQLWSEDAGSAFGSTLLVSEHSVLVAGQGTVASYGRTDGRRLWLRDTGLGLGPATLAGGQLWLGVGTDLWAWSSADGSDLWRLPGAHPLSTQAAGCIAGRAARGLPLGLVQRGTGLAALGPDGSVLKEWTLPGTTRDVTTASCRAGRVWVTSYAADGSGDLVVATIGARR